MGILEQSIVDICKTNGLRALSFSIHPEHGDRMVHCFAHRGDKCESADGPTLNAAVSEAIDKLNRASVEIADVPV